MTSGQSAEVIDFHCHVPSTRFIPRSFVEGSLANIETLHKALGLQSTLPALRERTLLTLQDHEADGLVKAMDESGTAETVLLLPDFTYALPDCELTIAEMFDLHRQILQRHPGRLRVLAGVDARWGGDAIDLFERGVTEYGFSGLKLYPPCGVSASDPGNYPLYEICAQHGLPVLLHMGPTSSVLRFDLAHPSFVDKPALDFPQVDFVLAHAPITYPTEASQLCEFRPNVYMDISGFQTNAECPGLEMLLEKGIAHKILYGTDWPVFALGRSHAETLQFFDSLSRELISDTERTLILSANAKRLLEKRRSPR